MSSQNVLKIIDTGGGILRAERTGDHRKVRILVIAETYPLPNGAVRTSNYFHERNKYYQANGFDVTMLNFSTAKAYSLDGVKVIDYHKWKMEKLGNYDILISHAPNIKHHFPFLIKYGRQFKHILFFFHGQEVLKINQVYPKPYVFIKSNHIKTEARSIYDMFKLTVWRGYFPTVADKSDFIFVSKSLEGQFLKGTRINEVLADKSHIVSNGVGKIFESVVYDHQCKKQYDFITVRSNIDASTYCIDLLCELAKKHKEFRFLLIGEGRYFDYFDKPDNLTFIPTTLNHSELICNLQKCRAALMLTRNDTQGVMSCEISSTGMPLITSDIKACREIFSCFPNVKLVENNVEKINLEKCLYELETGMPYKRITDYYAENTVRRECDIIKSVT